MEEKKRERPKWQCDTSLFGQRKKENDSRGLFDTEKVLKRQFMLDWERIVCKSRFRRLVGREDAGVRKEGQGLEEELEEVREELYAKRDILRMAFIYYSMMSGYARKYRCMEIVGRGRVCDFLGGNCFSFLVVCCRFLSSAILEFNFSSIFTTEEIFASCILDCNALVSVDTASLPRLYM